MFISPKFSTIYSITVTSPGLAIIFDFTGLKFQDSFGWTLVNKFIDIGSEVICVSFWSLFIKK